MNNKCLWIYPFMLQPSKWPLGLDRLLGDFNLKSAILKISGVSVFQWKVWQSYSFSLVLEVLLAFEKHDTGLVKWNKHILFDLNSRKYNIVARSYLVNHGLICILINYGSTEGNTKYINVLCVNSKGWCFNIYHYNYCISPWMRLWGASMLNCIHMYNCRHKSWPREDFHYRVLYKQKYLASTKCEYALMSGFDVSISRHQLLIYTVY